MLEKLYRAIRHHAPALCQMNPPSFDTKPYA